MFSKPTQNARPNVDVLDEYVDQRLADVEAGGIVPEAEAMGDIGVRQVLRGVVGGGDGETDDDDDQRRLQRQIGEAARQARR